MEQKYLSLDMVEAILGEFKWPMPFYLEDELPDGVIVNFPACHFILQEVNDGLVRLVFLPEDTGVAESLELGHAVLTKFPPERQTGEDLTPGLANDMSPYASLAKVENEVRDTLKVLHHHFLHVVEGDFSWVNRYLEIKQRGLA